MPRPLDTSSQWFVYIIENRLGHWYTGVTLDVSRRFAEHCSGNKKAAKALKGKGPLTLISVAQCPDKTSAYQLEYWIKQQSKAQKRMYVEGQHTAPFVYQLDQT
jgi:putative endonuclease